MRIIQKCIAYNYFDNNYQTVLSSKTTFLPNLLNVSKDHLLTIQFSVSYCIVAQFEFHVCLA